MKAYQIGSVDGIELRQNEDPVRAEEDPDAGVPYPYHRASLLRKQGVDRASCWVTILATSGLPYTRLCPYPSLKAIINLEYYRFNYQLSNEINFSGLISVLDAEVGLLRK